MMRSLISFLFLAALPSAFAESHPSWWGLASPEATALVGVRWETLSHSAFAQPVEAELWGSLNFPDISVLHDARQILISSPATVAMFYGNFPLATLRSQAAAKGMKQMYYRGVELWVAPGKTLSLAAMNEALVVVGARKSLQDVVERNQSESGTGRKYSPLLARGAKIAPSHDLWVIATKLPDPLANLFVPLETAARGFDGGVSVRDGIDLEATLEAGSEEAAATIADNLLKSISGFPQVARQLQVNAEADHVLLSLRVSRDALTAGLRDAEPAPAAASAPAPAPGPAPVAAAVASAQAVAPKPDPSVAPKVDPPAPAGPQVVKIFGLDDGPREIVLKPEKQ